MAEMRNWNDPEPTPNCIRCGTPLTPATCADEFIETGICSDCWTPEDEEDNP